MKNTILTLVLVLFSVAGISQDLSYNVHGRYSRPANKEKLGEAKRLRDVVPGYPIHWISNYISVEISATCNGKSIKAVGKNEGLNRDQKNLLKTIDLGADVIINVNYTYKVPVTGIIENNTMHVPMTVVPEIEAEYIGGHQQLMDYLKENGINKIPLTTLGQFKQATIRFTINEEGEIADPKVYNTSSDKNTDNLLLEVISKMPKWKPAENAKGTKVKQEFEFNVYKGPGKDGC